MWSEESLEGRASRALRNDLQNASSDMVGGGGGGVAFLCVVCSVCLRVRVVAWVIKRERERESRRREIGRNCQESGSSRARSKMTMVVMRDNATATKAPAANKAGATHKKISSASESSRFAQTSDQQSPIYTFSLSIHFEK
jgi:hypothetical protein